MKHVETERNRPGSLFTTVQLAEYLQVPVNTLYQWRHRGIGPRGIRVGRFIRYRAMDVDRWLDAQP